MVDELLEKFWSKVKVNPKTDCWEWQKGTASLGYGWFWIGNGKQVYAHRFAYEVNKGKIPNGLELDHLCRNHKCCNPDHLEMVTSKENVLRGKSPSAINLNKVCCPAGHPYSGDNLYVRPNGGRSCRECNRYIGRKSYNLRKTRKKSYGKNNK